jgi:hypothetical protein
LLEAVDEALKAEAAEDEALLAVARLLLAVVTAAEL